MIVFIGDQEPYAVCDACSKRFERDSPSGWPQSVQIGNEGTVTALCESCSFVFQGTVEMVAKKLVEPILEAAKGL